MEVASTKTGGAALLDWGALGLTLGGVALGVFIALFSPDSVMQFHAVIFALFALAGTVFLAGKAFSSAPSQPADFYADNVIKAGTIATVCWGVAGFMLGDMIAWQLAFPALNFDMPWTNFGRLRPVHTSAVVFAFGGMGVLATSL